ncbi:hypothetical protein Scep_021520 [Stephania cephalantha]|uniref:Uncharacterized protein n=1 Tax=Stephania cephalantha TaxID=152367 RepID=A0AAP0F3L1_9MAGN
MEYFSGSPIASLAATPFALAPCFSSLYTMRETSIIATCLSAVRMATIIILDNV